MYKRSFHIKSLPPIVLEDFKCSIRKYNTNYVTLIEVIDNPYLKDTYYLINDIDDIKQISKNFFYFLIDNEANIENKTIYVIPLSAKLNIVIEEINKDKLPYKIATIYFKTLKEAQNFEIPKFFGEEITNGIEDFVKEQEYIEVNSNDIILLFAKIKELDIDEDTKIELLNLYTQVINSAHNSTKSITISINKNSKIISLLGYNEKIATKKMI